MPKFHKITVGFVDQEYNEQGQPIAQEFVAGDTVEYENRFGEPINPPADETYQPFNMVQPIVLLEKPFTRDQMFLAPAIDVVLGVPLEVVMNCNFEDLMDYFEEQITGGDAILSDISYDMVGCDSLTDLVYLRIEAYIHFS